MAEGETGKVGLGLRVGGFKGWPDSLGSFISGTGEPGRTSREGSSMGVITEAGRFPLGSHQRSFILVPYHQSPCVRRAGVLQGCQ